MANTHTQSIPTLQVKRYKNNFFYSFSLRKGTKQQPEKFG
jgi:hypothetical protein